MSIIKIARERGHGELLQYGNVAHLPEVDAGVAEENGTKGISCRCHVHVTEDDRATRKIVTRHSLSGDDFGGLAECGQTGLSTLTPHPYRAWTVKPHNQKRVSVIPFFFFQS